MQGTITELAKELGVPRDLLYGLVRYLEFKEQAVVVGEKLPEGVKKGRVARVYQIPESVTVEFKPTKAKAKSQD